MKTREVFASFNRGRISRHALARIDVSRVALSAEVSTNWLPRRLGPMSIRPGLRYDGEVLGDGAYIPFIYDIDDTAILELSASKMRIWDDGTDLVTRASVSSSITNGGFDSDVSGWTDASDASAIMEWNNGGGAGVMRLVGTGYGYAKGRQEITVSGGDINTEHALRIVIERGPVILRIGSSAGDDDVFRQSVLRTGTHSIAFTPSANFWIEFSSPLKYAVWVDSVSVESSGTLELPTLWTTADLCKKVRHQASGDVIYCACDGVQQQRIERRPNGSWSVVTYEPTTGPFLVENVEPIRLTPSAIEGYITLTASKEVFQSDHVGAIFRVSSIGQTVEADLTGEAQFTDPIRVTGVSSPGSTTSSSLFSVTREQGGREFNIEIAGTWSGTVSLQRSVGEIGSWSTVATYTSNQSIVYDDDLDNAEVYYRLGIETGNYSSGTAECSLIYDVGSITGVVRIVGYTSATSVNAIVIKALGNTDATEVWAEGAWSDVQGYPQAVVIGDDGRLWWSGGGRNYGSVPDAFDNFDPDIEGDGAPINRGVGTSASNTSHWMLALDHIVVGTTKSEYSIRSTSFDEPVTPSNYNTKPPSTKGSAAIPAVTTDNSGFFVGRSIENLYQLKFDGAAYRYAVEDMTLLVPEIGEGGFSRLGIQTEPDTWVHAIRSDGTLAVMVFDGTEDVLGWTDFETDGEIEDVVVLPGSVEDRVWFRVKRTIDGNTVRYHEKLAELRDCVGGAGNHLADSFLAGSGAVTGLDHLEGETVVIWGDSQDQGTGVVSGGAVAGHSYDDWVVGLPYTATYKSSKLALQTQLGLSLAQRSRINSIGLILTDTYTQGLEFGPDFTTMDYMPLTEDGAAIDEDSTWTSYDEGLTVFPGDWDVDSRICLRAQAPKPCTVLAAVFNVDIQDRD